MKEDQISMFGSNAEIKLEIDKLREEIRYHNEKYYDKDEPEISDYEYDKLTQKLRKLEEEYPEFKTEDSPTQRVGGKSKKIFSSVIHDVQMQSLQDVFSFEDVVAFVDKVQNEYGFDVEFTVEKKIDGLSVSLEYENGILVRGSTRGDGFVGEDVTENLKVIKSIPHKLKTNDTIEVRGEVYLPREEFENINRELERNGKQVLSNPRNAAAGTLRQLDSKLVEARNLNIFIFNVQKGMEFRTHYDSLEYLKSIGIRTIEHTTICKTKEEVVKAIEEIGKSRDTLPYDIDGAVVKVNDLSIRIDMGSTVKVPKWAVAYKYPPEQKTTKVLDIIVNVGRTGQVTPMAVLDPVRVAGSVISRTTLHNFDILKELDVRIGDTVIIEKAGDVIPEVTKVLTDKRDGSEIEYNLPEVCPVCNEILEKEEGAVALRCTNSECPAQLYRSIIHFASRGAMDISGLGEAIVETFIEKNIIKDIADIYYIKYEDIISLERFADKSVKNLLSSIENTKSNTLDKFIFGLGIRHIGKKAAKILSQNFDDIYEIMVADFEKINSLDDFGGIMALSVVEFFKKDETKYLIEKFKNAGVNLNGNKVKLDSENLTGKTFCITGSFDNYKREDIAKLIELNGGKVTSSVTKKTNFLIAGENAGSKLSKAAELNIQILTMEELENMIK